MTERRRDAIALAVLVASVLAVYLGHSGTLWGADWLTLHQFHHRWAESWFSRFALGEPAFANIQSHPPIPQRFFAALFPVEWAYEASVGASAVLAALAAYFYARTLSLSPEAAWGSGFTFACSSWFAARVWAGHLPVLEAAFSLPLLLALVELGWTRTLAVATAWVVLSGHPQIPAYSVAAAAVYVLARKKERQLLVALGAGVLLSAFQWLPMLGLISRSQRTLGLPPGPGDVHVPLWRLPALFAPAKDGIPILAEPFADPTNGAIFWDTTAYVGLLAWVGAPLLRRRPVLLGLGAAALVLAMLPIGMSVTHLRAPARILYVLVLVLSVAFGELIDWGRARKPALALALLLVQGGDMVKFATRLLDPSPPPVLYGAPPEAVAFLESRLGGGRIDVRSSLPCAQALQRDFDSTYGYGSLFLASTYRSYYRLANSPLVEDEALPPLPQPALESLAVRFVVREEVRDVLPSWNPPGFHWVGRLRVPCRNGRTLCIYELPNALPRWSGVPVTVVEHRPSRHQLKARGPGRLRVAEALDLGWSATVDGKTAPIAEVDGFLMGLELEPGEHDVVLAYSTPLRWPGVAVTIAAFLLVLVIGRRKGAAE